MNIKSKLLSTAAIIAMSASTIATAAPKADGYDNDYDSNYYAAEGSILFKIRGSAIMAKSKNKGLPAPTSGAAPKDPGHLVANGYGIEGATTVFFTDNLGAELGLGFMVYRTSKSAIAAIGNNYSTGPSIGKRQDIYAVPLTLTAQFLPAPFGPVRPYIGLGGHATYMFSKNKAFTIGNAYGYVVQVGVDFVLRDDTMINFDIKQYGLEPKVTYKDGFLGAGKQFSSKLKINPVVISLGLGFKF